MTTSLLRATAQANAALGSPVPVLIDGASTTVTANGLGGYKPKVGDRLLVSVVDTTVEVVQFLGQAQNVDGKTLEGPTIIGPVIRTGTTPPYVQIDSDVQDRVQFVGRNSDPTTEAAVFGGDVSSLSTNQFGQFAQLYSGRPTGTGLAGATFWASSWVMTSDGFDGSTTQFYSKARGQAGRYVFCDHDGNNPACDTLVTDGSLYTTGNMGCDKKFIGPQGTMSGLKGGVAASAAISGTGTVTITHGMTVVPTAVVATPITANRFLRLTSVTSTQAVFEVRDSSNTVITTGTVSYHWLAYLS